MFLTLGDLGDNGGGASTTALAAFLALASGA